MCSSARVEVLPMHFAAPAKYEAHALEYGVRFHNISDNAWEEAGPRTYARHLDSALVDHQLRFYRAHPKYAALKYPFLHPAGFQSVEGGMSGHQAIFPWIEKKIASLLRDPLNELSGDPYRADTLAKTAIDVQTRALMEDDDTFTDRGFPARVDAITSDPIFQGHRRTKRLILVLHDHLREITSVFSHAFTLKCLPEFSFHRDLVSIPWLLNRRLIVTFSMFLNVLDKMESQYHFYMYISLASSSAVFSQTGYKQMQLDLYDLLEDAQQRIGSAASKLYKLLEPLCIGYTLMREPSAGDDKQFLGQILADLVSGDPYILQCANKILTMFTMHTPSWSAVETAMVMDSYGQEKLHFFPMVRDEGGMVKMFRFGTSLRATESEAPQLLRGIFAREFCSAYYSKHGSLPQIYPAESVREDLLTFWAEQHMDSWKFLSRIPTLEWAKLRFRPAFQFDYFPDILDLVDDKACAPRLSRLNQIYDMDTLKVLKARKPPSADPRRLIDWTLRQPGVDVRALFDECDRLGHIPQEQTLILLKSKERENKVDPRMYSVLHPHNRFRASSLEKNLSESIFPYFPQQTMTSSGPALIRTVDRFATRALDASGLWVTLHIDLEQWNYTFRASVLTGLEQALNELFGVTHYRWAMAPFLSGTFVNSDMYCPPGLFPEWQAWSHYPGGNQGICQKLWTLATILIIKEVMARHGHEHELMGSGDNQVLSVKFPKGQAVEVLVARLKGELRDEFSKYGLIVKTEETWYSTSLIAYQRKYYRLGVYLPLGLKSCARFAAGTSEGEYNVHMHTGTAMAAATTLASSFPDPLLGPYLGYVEWYLGLLSTPSWAKCLRLSDSAFVAMSCLTSAQGHLPAIQLPGFLYSGHKDSLTEALALARRVSSRFPEIGAHLVESSKLPDSICPPNDPILVVRNGGQPYVRAPRSAEALVRSLTEEYLRTSPMLENETLRLAFEMQFGPARSGYVEDLLKLRPQHLHIIHAAYECSPYGQVETLIGRVTGMGSVRRMAHMNQGRAFKSLRESLSASDDLAREVVSAPDILSMMASADKSTLKWIARQVSSRSTSSGDIIRDWVSHYWDEYCSWASQRKWTPLCTLTYRVFWTAKTNGLDLATVDGMFLPAPFEQLQRVSYLEGKYSDDCIWVIPARDPPVLVELLDIVRGPFNMCIGSSTREPVRSLHQTDILGADTSTAVRTLLKILAWTQAADTTSVLRDVLLGILEARAPGLRDAYLSLVHPPAGGCRAHRMALPGDQTGAYMALRTCLSTWYMTRTDKASKFQRSEQDYLVYFQALYQGIYAKMEFRKPVSYIVMFRVRTECCGYLIPEVSFSFDRPVVATQGCGFSLAASDRVELGAALQKSKRILEVQALVPSSSPPDQRVLAATQAVLFARHMAHYQQGQVSAAELSVGRGQSQSLLNVTLLRKCSISSLMRALVVAMAYSRCFGRHIGPSHTRRQLTLWAQASNPSVDRRVFDPLLDGVITAGKARDLLAYAQCAPSYTSDSSSLGLLHILLKGLERACIEIATGRWRVALVVCGMDAAAMKRNIGQFLSFWCPAIRRMHPTWDAEQFMDECIAQGGKLGRFVIVTSDSLEPVIERARTYIDAHPRTETSGPLDQAGGACYRQIPCQHADLWAQVKLSGDSWPIPFPEKHTWASRVPKVDRTHFPYMHQLLRWSAPVSGAYLKVEDVLSRMGLAGASPSIVICLAEGGGSVAASLLHLFPQAKLVFNTLLDANSLGGATLSGYMPPALLTECIDSPRLLNLPYCSQYLGDLTEAETWDELSQVIPEEGDNNLLVTLDMENAADASQLVIPRLIEHLLIWKPRAFVLKGFVRTISHTLWATLWDTMSSTYELGATKPLWSNPLNSEVYFWGRMTDSLPAGISGVQAIESLVAQLQIALEDSPTTLLRRVIGGAHSTSERQLCLWESPTHARADPRSKASLGDEMTRVIVHLRELIFTGGPTGALLPRALQHAIHGRTGAARTTTASLWTLLLVWGTWSDMMVTHVPYCLRDLISRLEDSVLEDRFDGLLRALHGVSIWALERDALHIPCLSDLISWSLERSPSRGDIPRCTYIDRGLRFLGLLLSSEDAWASLSHQVLLHELVDMFRSTPPAWNIGDGESLFPPFVIAHAEQYVHQCHRLAPAFHLRQHGRDWISVSLRRAETVIGPCTWTVECRPSWAAMAIQTLFPSSDFDECAVGRLVVDTELDPQRAPSCDVEPVLWIGDVDDHRRAVLNQLPECWNLLRSATLTDKSRIALLYPGQPSSC